MMGKTAVPILRTSIQEADRSSAVSLLSYVGIVLNCSDYIASNVMGRFSCMVGTMERRLPSCGGNSLPASICKTGILSNL
jgi:hypothetical protein